MPAQRHDIATLRRATPTDLASVERLLLTSKLPLDGVAENLNDFVVAICDNEVVGVAGLEVCCDQYALLRSTAVDEAWRSRGVGRRLVERLIADAEARGIHALYLLTTTAERYFPSFGFATVDRATVPAEVRATAEFTGACPASATAMALALGGEAERRQA